MSGESKTPAHLNRNALIYTISELLARAVSFIMLPVYTRYLTSADYGVLALLQSAVDIAALALTAGVGASFGRTFLTADSDERRRSIVTSAFVFEVGAALIGAILLWVAAPLVARLLLQDAGLADLVRLSGANFVLGALGGVPLLYLQFTHRATASATVSIVRLVLQLSLNIVFVVVLGMKVSGVMWSTFFAYAAVHVTLAAIVLREAKALPRVSDLKDLRKFSVPYQVSTAGNFALTFGDRLFLGPTWGAAVVGVYSVAYQFGFLLIQLFHTPFFTSWTPVRYEMAKLPEPDRSRANAQGFFRLNLLVITGALGIIVFVRPVLSVLVTPEFFPAAELVPAIILAYVIAAWTLAFKFQIDISGEVWYFTYATWIAAVVTLVLYAVMIPPWGAQGAAWATVGGFAVRLILTVIWATRLWPLDYGILRAARPVLIALVLAAISVRFSASSLVEQLLVATSIMLTFLGVVYVTLETEDQEKIRSLLRRAFGVARPRDPAAAQSSEE